MTNLLAAGLLLGALALAGCGSSGNNTTSSPPTTSAPTSSSAAPAPTASSATSSSATSSSATSSSAPAQHCPDSDGGMCVGRLTPGVTYTTQLFDPTTSYSVTKPGWTNYEDNPGNFLLVPPGNDLGGVNAGTSDYIGIYTSVAPAQLAGKGSCDTQFVKGVPATPAGMVQWMQQQPALLVTEPKPANVGGLKGLVTDVKVKPGAPLPSCIDSESGQKVVFFLLFTGKSPSSLEHGVIPKMTMRLYLLSYDHQLSVVEVDDIDAAPGNLTSLSAEVQRITFQT